MLKEFPVRKTKEQKKAFRDAVQRLGESFGYEARTETGRFGSCNLIFGDPEEAKFLITAYYGTNSPWLRRCTKDNASGVVTLLEIAKAMPANQRKKVCFVLFDRTAAGFTGAASHRRVHEAATDSQIVLNLDGVGEGNHIRFLPTKQMKADRKKLTSLYRVCGYFGEKDILVQEKGRDPYASDHKEFPWGAGICTDSPGNTIADMTNTYLLRAALISYITQAE